MKNILLFCCFFSMALSLHAQYYYQDIYGTAQTNIQHRLYEKNNVKSLSVLSSSSGEDNSNSSFTASKLLSSDYTSMTTVTGSEASSKSTVVSIFDTSGRVEKVTDSIGSSENIISYRYDSVSHLSSIFSTATSIFKGDTFAIKETHHYYYNSQGKLVKMERLKGNALFSTVSFELDSLGNVVSEMEKGKGIDGQRIYYRYNNRGQMTDVIRYNSKLKRLLPDYMMDYDSSGRMVQQTTVTPETLEYILCKYSYNERGLKESEICYGKNEQLLGNMRYQYSFYENVNK